MRSIGVSNFSAAKLAALLAHARIRPAVCQASTLHSHGLLNKLPLSTKLPSNRHVCCLLCPAGRSAVRHGVYLRSA